MSASFSTADHAHMARALRLAERGLYTTQPNPRVGCVIAHGDAVVGEGWHERAGQPHAEVHALRMAGDRARGATAYVTLEPCAHFGRTPPCADALVAAGLARVVVAAEDPNPRIDGQGVLKLRTAGIAVEVGLMRAAAREMNRGFFSRIERARPWVRIKLAMSLDGRTALADGRSKWITGPAARADVQRWRARSSALMAGSGTVLADDPRLTVRLDPEAASAPVRASRGAFAANPGEPAPDARDAAPQPVPPLRVVLDRALRTPAGAHVLDGSAPTLIVHDQAEQPRDDRFAAVERLPVAPRAGRIELAPLLAALAARGVNELQVEAGPTLCGALFAAGLVDELVLYVAPVMLGDAARPLLALPPLESIAAGQRLRIADRRQIGDDLRLHCLCDD